MLPECDPGGETECLSLCSPCGNSTPQTVLGIRGPFLLLERAWKIQVCLKMQKEMFISGVHADDCGFRPSAGFQ